MKSSADFEVLYLRKRIAILEEKLFPFYEESCSAFQRYQALTDQRHFFSLQITPHASSEKKNLL